MSRNRYTQGLKLRQTDEGQYIDGYVVRYGDVYNMGRFSETIAPGAFEPTDRVELNIMHDRSRIIGSYPDTVQFQDSPEGLKMSARMLDTNEGRDAVSYIENGVLVGLSAEFKPVQEHRQRNMLIVEKARLHRVGLVANPAYPKSSVSLRDAIMGLRDIEEDEYDPLRYLHVFV